MLRMLITIRRIVDCVDYDREATLYAMLCDGSKAFDRIRYDSPLMVLQRFGVRGQIVHLIAAINCEWVSWYNLKASNRHHISRTWRLCKVALYRYIHSLCWCPVHSCIRWMRWWRNPALYCRCRFGDAEDVMLLFLLLGGAQAHLDAMTTVGAWELSCKNVRPHSSKLLKIAMRWRPWLFLHGLHTTV